VKRLIAELYDAVGSAADPSAAGDVILNLAAELLRRGQAGFAAELACRADALLDRVSGRATWVSGRRAMVRAVAGDLPSALAVVQRLDDPNQRARTTRELALLLDSAGELQRATALAVGVPGVGRRAEAITALARSAVDRGDWERATGLATEVERLSRGVGDPTRLAAAADHVVDGLIVLGEIDEAAALTDRIIEPDRRESALARVAIALAVDGRPAQAEELASYLATPRRVWVLAHLAELQARGGACAQTLTAVEKVGAAIDDVKQDLPRVLVMLQLARALTATQQMDEANALLRRAAEDTERLTDPGQLARALALLAVASAEHQQSSQLIAFRRRLSAVFEHVPNRRDEDRLRARVTECLAEVGCLTAAREQMDHVDNPADRIRALCAVAQRADPRWAAELLSEAAALMPAVKPTQARTIALARLADAGTALTLRASARVDPGWTIQPVAELLAGDSWSQAAPALARLAPNALRLLSAWVIKQLDQIARGDSTAQLKY
jgi:tetratricopeptide (TPR) repeat protein